jgi:hypothetical protein
VECCDGYQEWQQEVSLLTIIFTTLLHYTQRKGRFLILPFDYTLNIYLTLLFWIIANRIGQTP